MEGLKVVTALEMARIEKKAIQKGASEERFMEEAGKKVAQAAMEFAETRKLGKKVALLVGKGNNGGDAYAAGCFLLDEGYKVRAFPLYPVEDCSKLNRKFGEKFRKKRGVVEPVGEMGFENEGLILDGYLGTGFKGKVEKEMGLAIQRANESGKPILAIDIPSGLNGSTGEVGSHVIVAQETIALGLPKSGFFFRQGWNCVGRLRVEDFGLPKEAIDEAEAIAYLPKWSDLQLPEIVRTRHKYQAGYVVGYGGSKELPGAVKMAGLAALRAGAGIVRIFHPGDIGPAEDELISNEWSAKGWKEALEKAKAVFVGPGLGRSDDVKKWLNKHLKEIKQPCVLDADALLDGVKSYPKFSVLTPHRGEVLRVLGLKAAPREEELFAKVMRFCDRKEVIIVLKGAPTFVFAPKKVPIIVPRGDPGMAKAGTGDVLTGIIAAMLAQGLSLLEAAVLGVALHAIAGEEAVKEKTSYCLIAKDLIDFLPNAFQAVMKWKDGSA